jgi:hypothetical protein
VWIKACFEACVSPQLKKKTNRIFTYSLFVVKDLTRLLDSFQIRLSELYREVYDGDSFTGGTVL